MVTCSAPGKVILLGEHAVVYGKAAVAMAVDRRIRCTVKKKAEGVTEVNGFEINFKHHSYILEACELIGIDEPLKIDTSSELHSGAGLGSSAAITIATLGALHEFQGDKPDKETIAKEGFFVEGKVQGPASPIDTSTVTQGGAVILSCDVLKNHLWSIKKDDRTWNIHSTPVPDMTIVVGYTGVHALTSGLVAGVKNFYQKNTFARDVVDEIGELVLEGISAMEDGDLNMLGELMSRNHKLLKILGVSHPKLDSLVKASLRYSYGAKLTGAGGGGSMIALTDKPEKVSEVISKKGGLPFILEPAGSGVKVESPR